VTPAARVGVDHLEVKLAVGVGRQVNQQGAERLVISAAESGELPTGGIAQGQADSARRAAADLENQEAARAAAERRRARVGDGGIAALRIIGRKPALAFRLCDGPLVGAGPSHAASTRDGPAERLCCCFTLCFTVEQTARRIFVSVRDAGQVTKGAFYIALGVGPDGKRDVLGIWAAPTEGAKFWLGILTELKNRGVEDTSSSAATASAGSTRR
jgi:hypothetical protein